MSGYIQKFYGNNMFPDNSGKQVWRYYNKTPNVTINYFGGSCGSLWGACGNAWGNFTGHFCGGLGKGGFWRGLGAGVGLGLMNWAIGGFNNLMSPWGMGSNTWGGAFGNNWWNNGIGNGRTSGSGKCSCGCGDDKAKACEDKDEANIEKLDKALKNKDLDEAGAQKLYKEIKELIEEPLDKAHAKGNKITYERLLDALEDLAEDKDWTLEPDAETKTKTKAETETKPEAETETLTAAKAKAEEQEAVATEKKPVTEEQAVKAKKTNQPQQAEQTQQAVEQEEVEQDEPINVDELSFDDGEIIDGETYGNLDTEAREKVRDRYMSLLDDIGDDNEFRDKLSNLPDALRKDIKAKYIKDSHYTLYDGSEGIAEGNVIKATDLSGKTRDTVSAEENNPSNVTSKGANNYPETIVIHDRENITYTYMDTIDGEYIYRSDRDKQEYILVKNSDDTYDLAQFRWHKGYGKKDWS